MKQKVKRILVVFLIIAIVTVVGYLIYTGNRLSATLATKEDFSNTYYRSLDKTVSLKINNDLNCVYEVDGVPQVLIFSEFEDGIFIFKGEDDDYKFIAMRSQVVYDAKQKTILYKGKVTTDDEKKE